MRRENHHGKSGFAPLFLLTKIKQKRLTLRRLCFVVFVFSVAWLFGYGIFCLWQNKSAEKTRKELQSLRQEADADIYEDAEAESVRAPEILPKYKALYEINPDLAGWLTIDGTVIDYPVMQTMEDECYYLNYDFYGKQNKNGCLILDTDSAAGTGTKDCNYANGTASSTNLIIHGHTMRSGEMFGNLKLYQEEAYGLEHHIIRFDSLYEEREY